MKNRLRFQGLAIIPMQVPPLKLTIIFALSLLLLNSIHCIAYSYATTHAKVSSLQAKQATLQKKLALCNGAGKAEPNCTSAARDEIDTSLKQTKDEIAKLQIEARAGQNERASVWNERLKKFVPSRLSVNEVLKKNLGFVNVEGAIVFFESDMAFAAWRAAATPSDPVMARAEYASGKSEFIKSCLANTLDSEP